MLNFNMEGKSHRIKEYIERYFVRKYKYDQFVVFLVKYQGKKMCTRALKMMLKKA